MHIFFVKKLALMRHGVMRLTDKVALTLGRLQARIFQRDSRGPTVSILVPTMPSRMNYLTKRAIPSILLQSEQDFEVLIVTDSFSPEIAQIVKQLDSRFCYLFGPRIPRSLQNADATSKWCSAAGPALNLAISYSRGDYLARLDDDDGWFPDHLQISLDALRATGAEFVSSQATLPDGSASPNYRLDDPYYGPPTRAKYDPPVMGSPITWVYRRHLRNLRYDPWSWALAHNRPADINLSLRMWQSGVRIIFSDHVGAQIGARKNSGVWGLRGFLSEQ